MTWTLSVSTLITPDLRVFRFLEENREALRQFDEVLLVCQLRDHPMPVIPAGLLPPNGRVIESESRGISASRNIGIEHYKSDLIWFMDDDVRFCPNLPRIKSELERSPADINTLRIQDTESEKLYKRYGPRRKLSALELLQVSSIEITCKRPFLERTGLRFPEWIGVGTALPSGEENLFLNEALRQGAVIQHLPLVGCRHPLMRPELKTVWSKPNRTRCMGIVARQYGALGLLLCIRWTFRAAKAGVHWDRLRELWAGYLHGRREISENNI